MKFRAPEKGPVDYLAEWWSRRESRVYVRNVAMGIWHARYAWWPKAIPACEYDGIVVPRHYVWLEHYDFRVIHGSRQRRPYTATPPFKTVHKATREEAVAGGWA